jgi:putative flavoprotein involved in K+ transport
MPQHSETSRAQAWLEKFGAALEESRIGDAAAMFGQECYWRDLISFTWNIKTLEGRGEIEAMLAATLPSTRPCRWRIEGEAWVAHGMIEAWFAFETSIARGKGHLRLKGDQCWTLLTTMAELKGHEEKKSARRIKGVDHGLAKGRKTWLERRREEESSLGEGEQPFCLIIGGGQGGIALGARLRRLGVPTIIVEKRAKAGDSWRARYKSLVLHDPVWYDHLPYLPFPDDWPIFTPKDKVGDWLEMYAKVMELNYWGSAECTGAQYSEVEKEWAVSIVRAGKKYILRPKQLVFATGAYGLPEEPVFPGRQNFKGDQVHSSRYVDGAEYQGKNCLVIGSNNSAHDVCANLWESGASVTMIQRSSTLVVKSDTLMEFGFKELYSESALERGITTEKADLLFASTPFRIMHKAQVSVYQQIAETDSRFYDDLRKAGFMLDFGDDGSGLMMKALRRGSGFYIDVGASAKIVSGDIKLKSGVTVKEIKERSVVFSDGSELPADLIVYATGYGSMNGWVAQIVSPEVADKVGKCWGFGSGTTNDLGPWEGELRNMWKPTRQEALWFHGGNLALSRHYSQFLALQIKARMESIPTPVFGSPSNSPTERRA